MRSVDIMQVLLRIFVGFSSLVYVLYILMCSSVTVSKDLKYDTSREINNFPTKNFSWSYECKYDVCVKTPLDRNKVAISLETCTYSCSSLPLWPQPKELLVRSKEFSSFTKSQLFLRLMVPKAVVEDMQKLYNIFANNLPACEKCSYITGTSNVYITISVWQNDRKPKLTTDESYTMEIVGSNNTVTVNISAPTFFGSRHALETLTQLIWFDTVDETLKIAHDLQISDQPVFPHRGLMVDTARNFFPYDLLQKVVDGMAASKLNVLHLHLTDATSFPIILPKHPEFAEAGSYSKEKVYTPEDIRNLVEYARIRGIRVVLEIDAPSHVYAGWDHFPSDDRKIIICEENPFNAHLNPDNPEALSILRSFYEDLLELGTDEEYFHIGADEVNISCYGKTDLVKKYENVMHLWADYVNNMTRSLKSANKNKLPKNVIIWSSDLTNSYLNKLNFTENLVVQFWLGNIKSILSHGLKVVFSTVGHWYLDCGYGPWRPSMSEAACTSYSTWQQFYKYRPWSEFAEHLKQVLGGEACLWSETVVPDSLEVRLWPRVAAMAERLWSDPHSYNLHDVYSRISTHTERIVGRNIKSDAVWPQWCTINPEKCT